MERAACITGTELIVDGGLMASPQAEASGRFASAAMHAYLVAEFGMNTARLARKWSESSGDYGRMAEALGEEIDDPAAGLVTRDYLDKRLAELEGRILKFEASFTWKIIGLFGVQIVIFSLITKYL